ncbi:hypothetical protein P3H15_52165 [Rhodococcus sp. T2V]|uniref:hypothetical protein n=1 Tax=Rhodococcus sp. T2V TaxID=3034164 RepID=UPI0023E270E9|nr:hypothetical protein [Rhodococcus sp. T2V]MDF3313462.1 hypothetical protein [Rhodococcus sp. T2V]
MPDILNARNALEALRQRIFAGENVSASDLATAQAAVDVAEIADRGAQARAEKAAAEEAERRRERAKADAAELLSDNEPSILAAFDRARNALEALRTAIDSHNTEVLDLAQSLSHAGVPAKNPESHGGEVEHFDPRNHPLYELHMATPYGLTVDGKQHYKLDFSTWVHAAGHAAGATSVSRPHYPAELNRHLGVVA